MFTNRISGYLEEPAPVAAAPMLAGFAVCQLPLASPNALALQLLAQQQAYQQAIAAAEQRAFQAIMARMGGEWN